MLTRLIAFLVLVAFVSQTFSKVFIVADYYANTAAFAKNCENKAKPVLRCKGKCQMMKKLQEEEKKEQKNPDRKGENKAEIVLSSRSFYPALLAFSPEAKPLFVATSTGKETKRPRTLLRPPIG